MAFKRLNRTRFPTKAKMFNAAKRFRKEWPRVIAEGDSWFDYPRKFTKVSDTTEHLGGYSFGCTVDCLAKFGDTVEDMLDKGQWLPRIRTVKPRCLMFSGGGNDILGDPLPDILKYRKNVDNIDQIIKQQVLTRQLNKIKRFYQRVYEATNAISPGLPILMHGYDYCIPNGKRTKIEWPIPIPVAGPWLKNKMGEGTEEEPGKGITDLDERQAVVYALIDAFNEILKDLAAKENNSFVHVDCRGTLGPNDWKDEIHPNTQGFKKIAEKFKAEIDKLPDRS